jgi:hypothetical protein
MRKKNAAPKVHIQVQCTYAEREGAFKVAEFKGTNVSAMVRAYINKLYKALPEEAK